MSFKVVDRFLPRVTRKKTKTVSNLILEGGKEKKSKVKSESSSREAKKRGRREVGKARKKTKEREREEGYASSCRRERAASRCEIAHFKCESRLFERAMTRRRRQEERASEREREKVRE